MVHRATGANAAYRAYTAGGARSTVGSADDSQFMQEMAGGMMSGEARKAIEAAQNYGFTSVVKDSIQGLTSMASGAATKLIGSAETFMSFMGGNRSFPAAGNMDDRRHRLMNLDKGDSGMFSTQGAKQQFQMSGQNGMFGTAPNDKTIRHALLSENSEQDMDSQSYQQQQIWQQPGGPAHKAALEAIANGEIKDLFDPMTRARPGVPTLYDAGGTGSDTTGTNAAGSMGGLKMGQKSLIDKNKQASIFSEITKDATRHAGKIVQLIKASSGGGGGGGGGGGSSRAGSSGGSSGGSSSQNQGTPLCEASSDTKFYCGGSPQKGKYALIVTVKGPTMNVPGRIG